MNALITAFRLVATAARPVVLVTVANSSQIGSRSYATRVCGLQPLLGLQAPVLDLLQMKSWALFYSD